MSVVAEARPRLDDLRERPARSASCLSVASMRGAKAAGMEGMHSICGTGFCNQLSVQQAVATDANYAHLSHPGRRRCVARSCPSTPPQERRSTLLVHIYALSKAGSVLPPAKMGPETAQRTCLAPRCWLRFTQWSGLLSTWPTLDLWAYDGPSMD